MKTAIVILNWNTEIFLRKFLPVLLRSVEDCPDAEIIVADNDSTDGSTEMMRELFPHIRTLSFEKNLGFTGGYNKAFDEIYSDGSPEYFVLINSDIEVSQGWLQPLVEWMDTHPECGACAPKLHSWNSRDRFEYAGAAGGYIDRFGYPFCRGRVLGRVETDHGQYDKPAEVFWATGACLMVRSGLFRKSGGLDDRFFAHMEEIDLCWRMQLQGYTINIVPQSLVYHVGGGTLPSSSPFKTYLNFRNNLLMLENNLAMTYGIGFCSRGISPAKAASRGKRKAERMLRLRMFLDGLSAAVYLLTFRLSLVKSVIKAHRDFRRLRQAGDRARIQKHIETYGDSVRMKGIYDRWIIPLALFKGDDIFRYLREDISHKKEDHKI